MTEAGALAAEMVECGAEEAPQVAASAGSASAVSASPWFRAAPEAVLLGMPQLCLNGLSEGWLLKELGHRHWMLLARLAGQDCPRFVDERGAPVYAAFCALSIRDAQFSAARENQKLVISSMIARVSRSQMISRHMVTLAGRRIGEIEMVSVFVRRLHAGNHGVARFEPPGFSRLPLLAEQDHLAARAARLRAGRAPDHRVFMRDDHPALATARFEPCPSLDFNGAGFLYFSSFVAFVDRAEWIFSRVGAEASTLARATTRRREIFFAGNLDPGEGLSVDIMAWSEDENAFSHDCAIRRDQDGAVMARVFTTRTV